MGRDPHPFYAPPEAFLPDGRVLLPQEEGRHATRVVRLAAGDRCRIVDGEGGRYRVRIVRIRPEVWAEVEGREMEIRTAPAVDLAFPILRTRSRIDWLLEKGTEVGVDRFLPILWERSVKSGSIWPVERWRRIVREAMKQSERAWLPAVADPVGPVEAVRGAAEAILADPGGDRLPPASAPAGRITLLVGPEGGIDEEERMRLVGAGAHLWSLGPNRLRAETACIVGAHALAVARASGEEAGSATIRGGEREEGWHR